MIEPIDTENSRVLGPFMINKYSNKTRDRDELKAWKRPVLHKTTIGDVTYWLKSEDSISGPETRSVVSKNKRGKKKKKCCFLSPVFSNSVLEVITQTKVK